MERPRILILTQIVDLDDPILGFFQSWITEFAKQCDEVSVICLKEGRHALPENVAVYSLGKEKGAARLAYVARFYRHIWALRRQYDGVFVHMNPEYAALGGLLWRLWGKRIGLWYVHRAHTAWLRVGMVFAHAVFTSVAGSISAQNEKVVALGHGIEVSTFKNLSARQWDKGDIRMGTLGRLSRIKRIEIILDALAQLRKSGLPITLDIVGDSVMPDDAVYKRELERVVLNLNLEGAVRFLGAIPHGAVPEMLSAYDLSVNASPAGGIDKAVLESALAGPIAISSNISFKDYFGADAHRVIFSDAADLAAKIESIAADRDREALRARQKTAATSSDVARLIPRILRHLYAAS